MSLAIKTEINPNGRQGDHRARLRFRRRSYYGYHRRDEELADAKRAIL
jgi:hypothetical protein